MIIDTSLPLLIPSWQVSSKIRAYTTLRYPGKSSAPYAAFNLALHVGDQKEDVLKNRAALQDLAHLPAVPCWLTQTHSNSAVLAETVTEGVIADASYTQKKNTVCVVMTADCLPILVSNHEGSEVAAIHAGWQGLAKGVIENTLSKLMSSPHTLRVWIGPSIQQACYEVQEDFYEAFAKDHNDSDMQAAFLPCGVKRWLADVPQLAAQRLKRLGVLQDNITLSGVCTYQHAEQYFSYRRDGVTGRMASLIWISES